MRSERRSWCEMKTADTSGSPEAPSSTWADGRTTSTATGCSPPASPAPSTRTSLYAKRSVGSCGIWRGSIPTRSWPSSKALERCCRAFRSERPSRTSAASEPHNHPAEQFVGCDQRCAGFRGIRAGSGGLAPLSTWPPMPRGDGRLERSCIRRPIWSPKARSSTGSSCAPCSVERRSAGASGGEGGHEPLPREAACRACRCSGP